MATIDSTLTTGRRLYIRTAYGEPIVSALKSLGAHWDAQAKAWWISPAKRDKVEELLIGADKAEDEAREKGEPTPKEDPDNVRLVGKATYKGRSYYVRCITVDGQRCRLTTLNQSVDFWAPICADGAVITKRYEARQVWDGRRYSGNTRTQYTTLGSIQRFLRNQANPSTRRVQCHECDAWYDESEQCRECGGC